MTIIIIHYRYYKQSGPETYLFNIKNTLEKNGHVVIPFSVAYKMNTQNSFDKYFINPIGSKEEFHYSKQKLTLFNKIRSVARLFWSKSAYNNLNDLILDAKPDVIYLLQFFGKISPSILFAAKKHNIPVVHRISDFGLICGKNIFYHNNKVCTDCLSTPLSIVKKNCKNNIINSTLYYLALKWLRIIMFYKYINAIVVPAKNTLDLMNKDKSISKIKYRYQISTYSINKLSTKNNIKKSNIISYWGRIEEDKGLNFIISNMKSIGKDAVQLKIYGEDSAYSEDLKKYIERYDISNVNFMGYHSYEKLIGDLENCKYSIFASVWHDNLPNSLIESLLLGIPVIAPNFGCFNDYIKNRYNGFLYIHNDNESFIKTVKTAINYSGYSELVKNSIEYSEKEFSEHLHKKKLEKVFYEVTKTNI